jgi:regulator of replication initiation timing
MIDQTNSLLEQIADLKRDLAESQALIAQLRWERDRLRSVVDMISPNDSQKVQRAVMRMKR